MKKTLRSLLSLFLAVFMVASLVVIPSSAAGITKSSVTVTKGYQTTLKFSGSSSVTWSTGDKSIATVSSSGKVVGKAPGTTYIYAKAGGKTYKCKVNVVAAKITASNSDVTLDAAGDSQIVTMTVKGSHSGLTVGTTNSKVAKASWVKPVEWDGNKVKIKITARGEGTCKIKVYLKKYSKTCYKYIDVTVGDNMFEDPDDTNPDTSTGSVTIACYPQKAEVAMGGTSAIQVYCSTPSRLAYSVTDSRIATLTPGTSSGNYKNYTINGVSAGSTTIRFYDKNNTKKYVDVPVTVGGGSEYYTFYTAAPTKKLSSDNILKIQTSNSYNYVYMLVPEKYDEAYTNTLIAKKFNKYSYYTVYQEIPRLPTSTDRYYEFASTNNSYYGARYILIPSNHDEVKLNTAIAKYNNYYEYYTVYNERPTLHDTWGDDVRTWDVLDNTGKTVTRYMLVPYYSVDESKVQDIIQNDMNSNSVYSYYTVYTKQPVVNSNKDMLVLFFKSGSPRYMIVPNTGVDILKRNDAIQKETGVYEPYIMYSTRPTEAVGQHVSEYSYGGKKVYVLCTYAKDSDEDKAALNNITVNVPRGT